ncbi:hypothetical protein L208DRAFT_1287190, partial [Tricholoma matsutake]
FWWPNMKADIAWYIRTCHLCQVHQTRNLLIPPTIALHARLQFSSGSHGLFSSV